MPERDGSGIQSIVEDVRVALKRQLSLQHARGGDTLTVYTLDPEFEAQLAKPELAPDFVSVFRRAVAAAVGSLSDLSSVPVLLARQNLRARCARLLECDYPVGNPYLAVIGDSELSPDLKLQTIARVSLD
jgi:flagellar biosynthesis component FlhA